jgi:hypothetical protein
LKVTAEGIKQLDFVNQHECGRFKATLKVPNFLEVLLLIFIGGTINTNGIEI